jgi:hypothetical protein
MHGSRLYTSYLRFAARRGGHEALHFQCYSGVQPCPRYRLSIIVKVSPCVSTNWLGIRHMTGWWQRRQVVSRSGMKWSPDVPYKARCWPQLVVDDGNAVVVAHSTSTAEATLSVWSCNFDAAIAPSRQARVPLFKVVQAPADIQRRTGKCFSRTRTRLIHSSMPSWLWEQ